MRKLGRFRQTVKQGALRRISVGIRRVGMMMIRIFFSYIISVVH